MPTSTFSGRSVDTWVCGYELCGILKLAQAALSYNWTAGVMWLMWAAVACCVHSFHIGLVQFNYRAGNAQWSRSTVSMCSLCPMAVADCGVVYMRVPAKYWRLQCVCGSHTPLMRPNIQQWRCQAIADHYSLRSACSVVAGSVVLY